MQLVFSHVVDICLLQNDRKLYFHELSKIPTLAWAIKQEIMSQFRIPPIRVDDSAYGSGNHYISSVPDDFILQHIQKESGDPSGMSGDVYMRLVIINYIARQDYNYLGGTCPPQ
jgi:hypothetical protein